MDFLVIWNFKLFFAKILPVGSLRPSLWSLLAPCPKQPIFKVKRSPEQVIPPFCRFSYAIVHGFFGDPNSDLILPKFFSWMSVYLFYGASWPSRPKRPIFMVKRSQEQVNPFFYPFSCVIVHHLFWWSEIPPSFLPKFYLDVRKYLTYGASCPSRPQRPIFKVKRAPK